MSPQHIGQHPHPHQYSHQQLSYSSSNANNGNTSSAKRRFPVAEFEASTPVSKRLHVSSSAFINHLAATTTPTPTAANLGVSSAFGRVGHRSPSASPSPSRHHTHHNTQLLATPPNQSAAGVAASPSPFSLQPNNSTLSWTQQDGVSQQQGQQNQNAFTIFNHPTTPQQPNQEASPFASSIASSVQASPLASYKRSSQWSTSSSPSSNRKRGRFGAFGTEDQEMEEASAYVSQDSVEHGLSGAKKRRLFATPSPSSSTSARSTFRPNDSFYGSPSDLFGSGYGNNATSTPAIYPPPSHSSNFSQKKTNFEPQEQPSVQPLALVRSSSGSLSSGPSTQQQSMPYWWNKDSSSKVLDGTLFPNCLSVLSEFDNTSHSGSDDDHSCAGGSPGSSTMASRRLWQTATGLPSPIHAGQASGGQLVLWNKSGGSCADLLSSATILDGGAKDDRNVKKTIKDDSTEDSDLQYSDGKIVEFTDESELEAWCNDGVQVVSNAPSFWCDESGTQGSIASNECSGMELD
jgi:hypothetical protein